MKLTPLIPTLLAGTLCLASSANAAIITFGSDVLWANVDGTSGTGNEGFPMTTTFTDANDVTFTVTVASTLNTARFSASGTRFGIGSGNNVDNGNINAGESLTLSIAVSGTGTLDALSLESIQFQAYQVGSDNATFSNGGGSYVVAGPGNLAASLVTAAELAGGSLTALSESNVGTWDLTLAGVDNGGNTAFRLSNFTIDFTTTAAVPEPSSAALLGLGGLALILRRRK